MTSLPLNGFTVIDLTAHRAGPTAVRQLADWGADVIKIEQPGEQTDATGSRRDGPDFQNLHRNKRSISLNLKSKEGLAIFMTTGEEGRRHRRELQIDRKAPARRRLRSGERRSTRASSTAASRVRPGRAV